MEIEAVDVVDEVVVVVVVVVLEEEGDTVVVVVEAVVVVLLVVVVVVVVVVPAPEHVVGQMPSLPRTCSPAVVVLVEHQAWPLVTPVTVTSEHWL